MRKHDLLAEKSTHTNRHLAASLALVLCFLAGSMLLPASAAPAIKYAVVVPSGSYLGAYAQASGSLKADQQAAVTNLESTLGRKLNIDNWYYSWSTDFTKWRPSWDIHSGRIPMISWGGTKLSSIVNGSQDSLINARADGLKAAGGAVYLRWFWEMDADKNAGTLITSPSQFISAWHHLHDIFVARGATNVKWVWCPNAFAFSTGEAQTYYPGDAYVDWICADSYNWAPARPGASWRSFADMFAGFYAWGAPKAAPLMVGETGVLERAAGEKAAWISSMATAVKTSYPEIKALLYFDAYSSANFPGMYNWRLRSSTSSMNAFKALAADPYFGGSGSGSPPPPPPPSSGVIFWDGFESGNLSLWSSSSGLSLQSSGARSGSWTARAQSSGSTTAYATKTLPTSYSQLYTRVWFKVTRRDSLVDLLRFQSLTGGVASLFVGKAGNLFLRNDAYPSNVWSSTLVSTGTWHKVQIRLKIAGSGGQTEVWFDGQRIGDLSKTINLGTGNIARLLLGENVSPRSYDILYDDLGVSTTFLTT